MAMIRISIISVFPQLHAAFFETSLIKRSREQGILEVGLFSLTHYVSPKERIDAPACGHGAGMVLRPEIVEKAVKDIEDTYGTGIKVFFSPDGAVLRQPLLQRMMQTILPLGDSRIEEKSMSECHIILCCGRYEGFDSRAVEHFADYIISIGDYILMGGDVAAQVFLESFLRLIPRVVGNSDSVEHDSFMGPFLDYEAYCKPVIWKDKHVPSVLLSGDHAKINEWRLAQSAKKTLYKRFDWLRRSVLSLDVKKKVSSLIPSHYVVLMHDQVMVGKVTKEEGTTSVTTIDLHDIARSSATYGIKKVFIVTPLKDQQRLLDVFLSFWHTSKGADYNHSRFEAMSLISVVDSLQAVYDAVEKEEGKMPLAIATSAQRYNNIPSLSYTQQGKVWEKELPVLLIFGTGQGLSTKLLDKMNYLLLPIEGFSSYNHLSVRAAVAIILDRWLSYAPEYSSNG